MDDDKVSIDFAPHRVCRQHGKSYIVTAPGEDDLFLPVSQTELVRRDGDTVAGVIVPEWLARERGLLESASDAVSHEEQQHIHTSDDALWELGLSMALIIRGTDPNDALWEARKLAARRP